MRNAVILAGLWVGIILTAFSLVYLGGESPAPAQLALVERLAERTYVDPAGQFQFEKPPGWRAAEEDGLIHAVGPLERIEAWILYVEGADTEQAIQVACEFIDPCPGKEIESIESLDAPGFAFSKERITYATEDEDTLLYGVGFTVSDGSLALVVRGDRGQIERQAEGLKEFEESITLVEPEAIPETDVADVPAEDS